MTTSTREPSDDAARRPLDERPQTLIGATVEGRYRVVERIGAGGMGTVYRVEHLRLQRHFALKLLRSELCDEPGMIQRFERESRLAASVKSEHVVSIVDSGTSSAGIPYFVMELGDSDLRRVLLAEGPLAPVRAANLGIDTCRGLLAAHDKGLVHRDLKPENLLLARGDDGREIAKIADFGVAKAQGTNSTQPGALVGTVRYMAPEQVGLSAPVGPATDIYALGVILYECLSGAVPFEEKTTERTLYRIMTDTPEPLRTRCPDLPPGLAAAVDRALERTPAARHASARVFAEALLPFAGFQRTSAAAGLVVTTVAANADSDTAQGIRDPAFASTLSAADSRRSAARGSVPRTAFVVLISAAVGAGLVTLTAPEDSPPPEQASAPQVASRPMVSAASATVPSAVPRERHASTASSIPSAPEPATSETRPLVTPGKAALPPSAKNPRPAASSTGSVTTPRRQPPSTSFDPANPYGP
jgi:eukaryotic-like serine/threonine-protein kinase